MSALFISDLHLGIKLEHFRHFCTVYAPKYTHIFILGDLFDLYLGDDLIEKHYQEVVLLLSKISKHSTLYVMWGNRDFLLGKEFCKKANAQLIHEPYIYENIVALHGDSLVREDWKYIIFKCVLRNPMSIFVLKHLAKTMRVNLAKRISWQAKNSKKSKPLEIMDVSEKYCDKFMKNYTGKHCIHGHTHRPNIHQKEGYTRYVLPSWEGVKENIPGGFAVDNGVISKVIFS